MVANCINFIYQDFKLKKKKKRKEKVKVKLKGARYL